MRQKLSYGKSTNILYNSTQALGCNAQIGGNIFFGVLPKSLGT